MSVTGELQLELETSPRGIPCARLGQRQLHSTMDPWREADRMVQTPAVANADLVLVFGAGLGYVLESLGRHCPDTPVLVVEPRPELARQLLDSRQAALAPLLARGRLEFIPPDDPYLLVSRLQDAGVRQPVLLANPVLKTLFPEAFQACREGLQLFERRTQVNSNTLKRFGQLWVANFCRNRSFLPRAGRLADLQERFAGLPGLVLAGGPSLDEVLPLLSEIRQRLVLVAVDTSLRACLRHGVDPDFVVTMDPQYWNARHLDWTSHSRAIMVTESSIYPSSLRRTAGPVVLCSSFFPLARWYETGLGLELGKLGAGGSVATSAWDLLRVLGCSESWIAGLDLSCPGGKTHFHGALFEEQVHQGSCRTNPAETGRFGYLYNDAVHAVATDDGRQVLTDQRMDLYTQWFENQVVLHAGRTMRRLGEGNRPIRGLERAKPDQLLAKPAVRDQIDAILDPLRSRWASRLPAGQPDAAPAPGRTTIPATHLVPSSHPSPGPESGAPEDAQARLDQLDRELLASLETMASLAREALDLVARLETGATRDQSRLPAILARLDRIDHLIMDNPDSRIPGFLMEAEIRQVLESTAAASGDHGLAASRRLYEAMLRVTGQHQRLFRSSLP